MTSRFDLRIRIIQAVEVEGMCRRSAAERFGVAPSTAVELLPHGRPQVPMTLVGKTVRENATMRVRYDEP